MSDILTAIAAIEWIVVGIICFAGLRKWNKKFTALYDELIELPEGGADQ